MLFEDPFAWVAYVAFGAMSLAMVLAFVRLVRGPNLPDRVVALDLIAYLAIGFIAMYTIVSEQQAFLDAAITLALIAFLGTVAFARYIEHINDPENQPTRHES